MSHDDYCLRRVYSGIESFYNLIFFTMENKLIFGIKNIYNFIHIKHHNIDNEFKLPTVRSLEIC